MAAKPNNPPPHDPNADTGVWIAAQRDYVLRRTAARAEPPAGRAGAERPAPPRRPEGVRPGRPGAAPGPAEDAEASRSAAALEARQQYLDRREHDLALREQELLARVEDLKRRLILLASRRVIARDAIRNRRKRLTDFRRRVEEAHARATREIEALGEALAEREQALADRAAAIAGAERAIDEARARWVAEEADLRERRQRLEREIAELDARFQRDEAARRAAAAEEDERRQARWQREDNERAARIAGQEREVAERRAALDAEEAKLAAAWEGLRAEQARVIETRASLEQREHALAQARLEIERARTAATETAESLDRRRAMIERVEAETRAAHDRAEAELQQLAARSAALAAEAAQQDRRRSELDAREQFIEQRQLELAERAQELDQTRDELAGLRRAAESHEAELRQAGAAVAIERQEVATLRARLEEAQAELQAARETFEQESRAAQKLLSREARRLLDAPATGSAPARPRWGRALLATALTGCAAAAVAWLSFEPRPSVVGSLRLSPGGRPFATRAAEHLTRLRDAGSNALLALSEERRAAWGRLIEAGRVRIEPDAAKGRIHVRFESENPAADGPLLHDVCEAYVQHAPQAAALRELPAAVEVLDTAAQRAAAERARLESMLAELPAPETEATEAASQAHQVLADTLVAQRDVVDRLQRIRARVAMLEDSGPPAGVVDPEELSAAIDADPMHSEDLRELESLLPDYRRTISESSRGVPAAVTRLRDAVAAFRAALRSQHDARPPAELSRGLESAGAAAESCAERLDAFDPAWAAAEAAPQSTAIELLSRYDAAAEAARRAESAVTALVTDIDVIWREQEAFGGGSTREVVVLNAVRSALETLRSAADEVRPALQALDLGANFELDALDRQVRGLVRRLDERPAAIRAQLQILADDRAARDHATALADARAEQERLEDRREELAEAVAAQLERVRAADAAKLERERLADRRRALKEAIDARRADTAALRDGLDKVAAGATQTEPELVTLEGIWTEKPDERDRIRRAAMTGAAAAGVSILACGLLMLPARGRSGRRTSELQRVAEKEADNDET